MRKQDSRNIIKQAISQILRYFITWWFGSILLIGSAIGYLFAKNSLSQFIFTLTGEAALIFIVADLVEKQLRDELAARIIRKIETQVEQVSSHVETRLRQTFDFIDNAGHNKLLNVLSPRRDWDERSSGEKWNAATMAAIRDHLTKCKGELRIYGISLLDFFLSRGRAGEFFDLLQARAQNGDKLEIRVFLMDPQGHGIRLRKHVEVNGPATPLLRIEDDITLALQGIQVLNDIAAKAERHDDFSIKAKYYNFLPQAYLIITDSALFIEQYHFAPTDKLRFWGKSETNPCTGGRVPTLQFDRESTIYKAMIEHFDLLWEIGKQFGPEIVVRDAT